MADSSSTSGTSDSYDVFESESINQGISDTVVHVGRSYYSLDCNRLSYNKLAPVGSIGMSNTLCCSGSGESYSINDSLLCPLDITVFCLAKKSVAKQRQLHPTLLLCGCGVC